MAVRVAIAEAPVFDTVGLLPPVRVEQNSEQRAEQLGNAVGSAGHQQPVAGLRRVVVP